MNRCVADARDESPVDAVVTFTDSNGQPVSTQNESDGCFASSHVRNGSAIEVRPSGYENRSFGTSEADSCGPRRSPRQILKKWRVNISRAIEGYPRPNFDNLTVDRDLIANLAPDASS